MSRRSTLATGLWLALAGLWTSVVGIPTPAMAASASDAEVTALLAKFKAIKGLSANYREEKTMALLAKPLVSEGVVYYERPGALARHQSTPEKTRVVIEDGRLEYGAAHGKQSVDLKSNPIVRLFVDSFLDVLSGDRKKLEAVYRVEYRAREGGSYTLVLHPRQAPLTKMITRIEIEARGVVLERLTIFEVGGDTTAMVFRDVDPRRRFSASERASLFSVSPGS